MSLKVTAPDGVKVRAGCSAVARRPVAAADCMHAGLPCHQWQDSASVAVREQKKLASQKRGLCSAHGAAAELRHAFSMPANENHAGRAVHLCHRLPPSHCAHRVQHACTGARSNGWEWGCNYILHASLHWLGLDGSLGEGGAVPENTCDSRATPNTSTVHHACLMSARTAQGVRPGPAVPQV